MSLLINLKSADRSINLFFGSNNLDIFCASPFGVAVKTISTSSNNFFENPYSLGLIFLSQPLWGLISHAIAIAVSKSLVDESLDVEGWELFDYASIESSAFVELVELDSDLTLAALVVFLLVDDSYVVV